MTYCRSQRILTLSLFLTAIYIGTRPVAAQECSYPSCPETCNAQVDCSGGIVDGAINWCAYPDTGCLPGDQLGYAGCCCNYSTPVLLSLDMTPVQLTDAQHGVFFRWGVSNQLLKTSWTVAGADEAWLALDRNGNGVIDNSQELFGNYTPQPLPPTGFGPNGFNALTVYDQPQYGGNGDGKIDSQDVIYNRLLLWRDSNHNGISEPDELLTMVQAGIGAISLSYEESDREDVNGNHFKYRAKVYDLKGAETGRIAWDVYVVEARPITGP